MSIHGVARPPIHEVPSISGELMVIALVGSAGGLAAVSAVLRALPPDLDAAVIVLIHQAPDRESLLVHLLGRHSRLPVVAGSDGLPLRTATVVVAPPGKHMLLAGGPTVALIGSGAAPPSRPSADLLLTTLAIACGSRATAVVLSGHGHDGATGATAVHHFGGTVIASSHASSRYSSMPQATIEREGVTDRVIALHEIGDYLASIAAVRPG